MPKASSQSSSFLLKLSQLVFFLLLFFFAPLFVELRYLILRFLPRIASIIGTQLTTISSES